ncbi:amidohydrolase family protein [Pigmentiphaga soli]|uniref:Amidohydrolase family protein n=1 Tax=Pigmentiphaga soli TaxID=1007095 RepID=A0ABP8HS60_9BURK
MRRRARAFPIRDHEGEKIESLNLLGSSHAKPDFTPPAGACDCHVHVFEDHGRYPLAADRPYTPAEATLADLAAVLGWLGLGRAVIVQASPQGNDHACLADSLRAINRGGALEARGVCVIGSRTSDAELQDLHRAGVRGARVNLHTVGTHSASAARESILRVAGRVAPLGWHVQTFTDLNVIAGLRGELSRLPVPIVFDHFALARAGAGIGQPGFDVLASLLAQGKAYVKLSATYRMSGPGEEAGVQDLARALIDANPDRILWGSDWPHTVGTMVPGSERLAVRPFKAVDDGAALSRLRQWTQGRAGLLDRILVANPAALYQF